MADARWLNRAIYGALLIAACAFPQVGRRLIIARGEDALRAGARRDDAGVTATHVVPASWAWGASAAGVAALLGVYQLRRRRADSATGTAGVATAAYAVGASATHASPMRDARTTVQNFFALIAAPILEFDHEWHCISVSPHVTALPAFAHLRVGQHLFEIAAHCEHGALLREMLAAIYAPPQPATIYRALPRTAEPDHARSCHGASAMRIATSGGEHVFWIYCHTERIAAA